MTASDPYPAGIDPVHVLTIATTAAPDSQREGTVLLVGGHYAARVYLPTRAAAQAAHAALQRVGYQVGRTGSIRDRELIIAGWSAEGLESRLAAMRVTLHRLAAEPGATALTALGQLGQLPAAEVPGRAGQRLLIHQAGEQLRMWIAGTSGIHAPCDPRARPADPGIALRLNATRRAEEAIDYLAARHVQVAEMAVALYPALRQQMNHDYARDLAVRRSGVAFHLSRQLAQDTTPFMRGVAQTATSAASRHVAPSVTSPKARPRTGHRRRLRNQEFPFTGMPTSPASRPPSTRGATRPGGRTFPSGRPGRHR